MCIRLDILKINKKGWIQIIFKEVFGRESHQKEFTEHILNRIEWALLGAKENIIDVKWLGKFEWMVESTVELEERPQRQHIKKWKSAGSSGWREYGLN